MNLLGTVQPSSTIGARIALAPSAPPTGGWRTATAPSGVQAGNTVLPAPPPPPPVSSAVAAAIRANVGTELLAPSAPNFNWRTAVGQAGTTGNAGNIGGASSTVTTGGISLPLIGNVNPLWLVGGAVLLALLLVAE